MKLVIFDCDGTIVDSQHIIVAAMEGAFAVHGLPAPHRNDIVGVVGLSLIPAVARLAPQAELSLIESLAMAYKDHFSDLRRLPEHHEPLFPLAREIIHALSVEPDTRLGIATGKSRRGVDALFEREGLGQYFSTIQTADDNPSKPDPMMLMRAMIEAPADALQTVMVGDTTFDMAMARAARVGAIGVSWGYHPAGDLEAAGAHLLIDSYADLPAAITRLLAEQEHAP